jgi:hypothetical protein
LTHYLFWSIFLSPFFICHKALRKPVCVCVCVWHNSFFSILVCVVFYCVFEVYLRFILWCCPIGVISLLHKEMNKQMHVYKYYNLIQHYVLQCEKPFLFWSWFFTSLCQIFTACSCIVIWYLEESSYKMNCYISKFNSVSEIYSL